MKILQLIPNISSGGAERFVVDLSNELVNQDNQVTLVTLYDPSENDLFRDQIKSEVKCVALGKKLGFDWWVIRKLYKTIKKEQPEVIHTHLRTLNYLMPLIPFLTDTPIIHTVHNDAYKECPNPKIRKLRNYFFKKKKVFPVTISDESAHSFKEVYEDHLDHLIYNGRQFPQKSNQFEKVDVEVASYKNNPETKVFVNIGRQEVQKNQLMLVKAFRRLVEKDRGNAVLLIIGGGRNSVESREIQQELERLNSKYSWLHVLGERSNAPDYLYAADYFCMSSLFEGMPITLIEALATETIPLCTPVGGIPEMLTELEDSLLAVDLEVDSYYQTLKAGYGLREGMCNRLKKKENNLFKEKYSMEQCAMNYIKLYNKIKKY